MDQTNTRSLRAEARSTVRACSILIVEDEPLFGWVLEHCLSEQGYEVTRTHSGEHAIELLQHSIFDIVITDLRLSSGNGLHVVQSAMRCTKKPAVVMISAYGDDNTVAKAYEEGVSAFIHKPFNFDMFFALLLEIKGEQG